MAEPNEPPEAAPSAGAREFEFDGTQNATRGGGDGLPRFVEREFLSCGVLARGFARLRGDGCKAEMLVAFSCKGRGYAECWNMLSRSISEETTITLSR